MLHITGDRGHEIDKEKAKELLERATSFPRDSVAAPNREWVALAHNALGDLLLTECGDGKGQTNSENAAKALEHYRIGAAMDEPSAIFNLGRCHAEGIGSVRDIQLALRELHRASERNCGYAQAYLAKIYANGCCGVEKNECLAKELLARAIENGMREEDVIDTQRIQSEKSLSEKTSDIHLSSRMEEVARLLELLNQRYLVHLNTVLESPQIARKTLALVQQLWVAMLFEGAEECKNEQLLYLPSYLHTSIGRRFIAAHALVAATCAYLYSAEDGNENTANFAVISWKKAYDLADVYLLNISQAAISFMIECSHKLIRIHAATEDMRFFLVTLNMWKLMSGGAFLNIGSGACHDIGHALGELKKEIACWPNKMFNVQYLRARGQFRTLVGQFDDAVQDFNDALRISPGRQSYDLYFERGFAKVLLCVRCQSRDDDLTGVSQVLVSQRSDQAFSRRRTKSVSLPIDPSFSSVPCVSKEDMGTQDGQEEQNWARQRSSSVCLGNRTLCLRNGAEVTSLIKQALEDFETFSQFALPEDSRVIEAMYGMAICHILLRGSSQPENCCQRSDEFETLAQVSNQSRLLLFQLNDRESLLQSVLQELKNHQ
ncbi:hypothetical protein HDU97_006362 [Phlyctochytrium planicorne]|nr:hypothetical protein HDU97_006362 [Phlyctochytrium planicorne]